MNEQTPTLECRNLYISFFTRAGEIPAVVDFNLRLMPGEAHGIVGESGCGKSTVALAIMQYLGRNGKIKSGQILFEGQDLRQMSDRKLRKIRGSKIAMVYQEPMASLNPAMTIGRQLMEVPIYHEGVTIEQASIKAREILEAVKLPDPERMLAAYPHQISGGQQQRVVIAMALLANPKLLLLDEPTTALDVTVEAGIVELIKDISTRFGTTMIYISHNLGLILETCHRLTVMYSGEAVEYGDVKQVFDNMRHPYTRGLFESIPLPNTDKHTRPLKAIEGQLPLPQQRPQGCYFGPRCNFFDHDICTNRDNIVMQSVNNDKMHYTRCTRYKDIDWKKESDDTSINQPVTIGDTVLEVNDLSKHYDIESSPWAFINGKKKVIKANEHLNFDAKEAETLAIVGESGCGKSTFAKVLMGLEKAKEGNILFGDINLGDLAVGDRNKNTIASLQMVFQNPFDTLNPSQTVGSQIARVIRKFGIESDRNKIKKLVASLLDTVKLPKEFSKRYPRQLSGGQKQRVGIARAFAGNPDIVIADEPVSALDVSVQAAITELLMDIQHTNRTTLLFISHDLSIVRYIADRVIIMYLGQIMERGTTEEIFNPPYHPYTEALLSAAPIADTSITKRKIVLDQEMPSPINPPLGCPFSTRCRYAIKGVCEIKSPPIVEFSDNHQIACHLSKHDMQIMKPIFSKQQQPAEPVE